MFFLFCFALFGFGFAMLLFGFAMLLFGFAMLLFGFAVLALLGTFFLSPFLGLGFGLGFVFQSPIYPPRP